VKALSAVVCPPVHARKEMLTHLARQHVSPFQIGVRVLSVYQFVSDL
jgi:hypothetical protein